MAVESLNAKTLANAIAGSTDPQEVKWLIKSHLMARGHMPIKAWFGEVGGGRPITEVFDTRTLRGQEVVFSVRAGLGQRGTGTGESRADKAEKYKARDYRFKVGQRHHSVAIEDAAKDMTVIGSEFDKNAGVDLSEWLSVRQQEDVLAECFKRKHDRNTVRPNAKATTDDLNSQDTFSLNSVSDIKETMLSIGASPLYVRKGADEQVVSSYYVQGSQYLFADLNRDPLWRNLRAQAENRGSSNSNFAGGKPMVEGCILNEWEIKTNDYDAPQGARLMPFAILGTAIPADPNTANGFTIYGGGNATSAANTEVDYFQNFFNAPYEGFEGEKITADTSTERYLAIKSTSGANKGKIRLFAYQVNDGNKITITRALSSAATGTAGSKTVTTLSSSGNLVTWGSGDWTTDFLTEAELPIGSLIYQCNKKGQVLTYGLTVGSNMMVCGYGSSDGKTAFGKRTTDSQDFGRLQGIGILSVWGCRATQDTNNVVNGYSWVEAAYNPPGFPEITI